MYLGWNFPQPPSNLFRVLGLVYNGILFRAQGVVVRLPGLGFRI